MSNFEFNKIFAAILIAGIAAMFSGFVANKLVHPEKLEKDAVEIEGGAIASSGPAKPKGPEPVLHMIASADIARGEKLSRACAACHSFDNGGVNKVGPNLWATVNAKKGHISGFAYSDELLATGGKWTYESLNKFLYKPKAYAPGTKMNYIGMKKPEDRAAMIAWLRTLAPSAAPLPSEAQIAAEAAELSPVEELQDNADLVEEAIEGAADKGEAEATSE